MSADGTPRIGVLRPAGASRNPVVALAEARVVRRELERRLGAVTLDLRAVEPAPEPWRPVAHADWPAGVDATIDVGPVVGVEAPRLAALLGRTIDPGAADVRRRMLTHLGVLPVERLDDAALASLLPEPQRPTDVWLVIAGAGDTSGLDPAVRALGGDPDEMAAVDAWFESAVDGLVIDTGPAIERLTARVDALTIELAAAHDAAARSERLAVDRIDELQQECEVLRERLARAQLDERSS